MYTRKGDKGTTSLYDGSRVSKNNERIIMLSQLDDFVSHFGDTFKSEYTNLTTALMDICTIVASPVIQYKFDENNELVSYIEKDIDLTYKRLPKLTKFILPDNKYQIVRTKCRICEISLIEFSKKVEIDENIFPFMNRLSSFIFAKAYEDFIKNKSSNYYYPKFLTQVNENNTIDIIKIQLKVAGVLLILYATLKFMMIEDMWHDMKYPNYI